MINIFYFGLRWCSLAWLLVNLLLHCTSVLQNFFLHRYVTKTKNPTDLKWNYRFVWVRNRNRKQYNSSMNTYRTYCTYKNIRRESSIVSDFVTCGQHQSPTSRAQTQETQSGPWASSCDSGCPHAPTIHWPLMAWRAGVISSRRINHIRMEVADCLWRHSSGNKWRAVRRWRCTLAFAGVATRNGRVTAEFQATQRVVFISLGSSQR